MHSASPTVEPSLEPTPTFTPKPTPTSTPAATAEEAAKAIINTLRQQDLEKLSSYIHPEKGLMLSPYGHIEKDTALTFKAGELPAWDDPKLYKWGSYDGWGEPISLTFRDYFKKFVYDQNFAEGEKVGHNEILGPGNTLVTIGEISAGLIRSLTAWIGKVRSLSSSSMTAPGTLARSYTPNGRYNYKGRSLRLRDEGSALSFAA